MFTLRFRKSSARNENRAQTSTVELARQLRDTYIVECTARLNPRAQAIVIDSYERRARGQR